MRKYIAIIAVALFLGTGIIGQIHANNDGVVQLDVNESSYLDSKLIEVTSPGTVSLSVENNGPGSIICTIKSARRDIKFEQSKKISNQQSLSESLQLPVGSYWFDLFVPETEATGSAKCSGPIHEKPRS